MPALKDAQRCPARAAWLLTVLVATVISARTAGALAADAGSAPAAVAAADSAPADAALERDVTTLMQQMNAYWVREFRVLKAVYQPASLRFYQHALSNGCQVGAATVGPFYCPDESRVYLQQEYLTQLQARAGSAAPLALAYLVGHELGKHIQDLVGTTEQVEQARARDTAELSARTWAIAELQADCFGGLAVRGAQPQLARQDFSAALQAVASTTQSQRANLPAGEVMPDPVQSYATAAQRLSWFQRGLASGNYAECDTFSAAAAGKL